MVGVIDSYGKEHGSIFLTEEECVKYVFEVWENEVEPDREQELMAKAIKECIEADKKAGIISGNYDGLD